MGVWNSSKQTVHDIIPVFLLLSLLTKQAIEKLKTISLEINKLNWTIVLVYVWVDWLHFYVTWLLVVAERTGELTFQIPRHLLLRRRLSFGLAATHCTQTESQICVWNRQKSRSFIKDNTSGGWMPPKNVWEHWYFLDFKTTPVGWTILLVS